MNGPRTPHPDAHCRRKGCYQFFRDHGPQWECPDGKGVYKRLDGHKTRASTSFSAEEIELLDDVMKRLLSSEDMRIYARNPERKKAIAGILYKASNMRDSITRRSGARPEAG